MNILFTGASSFTGYWFVKTLCQQGHAVTCVLTGKNLDAYTGVRRARVEQLVSIANLKYNTSFGDATFINEIKSTKYDLFCHHAAFVQNYKEPTFDVAEAVKNNTKNIFEVIQTLKESGCANMVLTGSVFEGGEGIAPDNSVHFSPYGLSKSLSYQLVKFYTDLYKLNLGKFVIPNPFGPYEEPRFTAYLMNKWKNNEVPHVGTPDYVRDNIPVTLLATYYAQFCTDVFDGKASKIAPSGIADSQGAFTKIVSTEVAKRTGLACEFVLDKQTNFSEPMVRTGADRNATIESQFSSDKFWDEFVAYYQSN